MRLMLNGTETEVGAGDLPAILDELDYDAATVATAVNGEFVPRAARAGVRLGEGDRLEIVAPQKGG